MQVSFPPTDPTSPEMTWGRWQFIGNVTVAENLTVGLAAGNRRKVLDLSGVTAADVGKLGFLPLTPCDAGCEALNVYYSAAGKVLVAYSTPTLSAFSVINIPIAVYRII